MSPGAATAQGLELTGSGRVAAITASALLALALHVDHVAARLAPAMVLAPLLWDWLAKVQPWRRGELSIECGRRRAVAGAAFATELRIRNRSRRPLRHAVVTELGFTNGRGLVHGAATVEHLAGGGAVSVPLAARARTRGRCEARTFAVTTAHPFGLVARRTLLTCGGGVVVEPARAAPRRFALPAGGQQQPEPRPQLREATPGAEFWSLREIGGGEVLREVHALRSAALAMPVRAIRREDPQTPPVVVLDLRTGRGLGHAGARPRRQRIEWAVSVTAWMVDELVVRRRMPIDLVVLAADRVRRYPRVGEVTAGERALDDLATVRPGTAVAGADDLMRDLLGQRRTVTWIRASDGDSVAWRHPPRPAAVQRLTWEAHA